MPAQDMKLISVLILRIASINMAIEKLGNGN
jgi:hypothetical protein